MLKRLKDTFSTSSSKTKDKNVAKVRGLYYGAIPNPIDFGDEKTPHQLLSIRLQKLKVHMVRCRAVLIAGNRYLTTTIQVARYPDQITLTSPYMKVRNAIAQDQLSIPQALTDTHCSLK